MEIGKPQAAFYLVPVITADNAVDSRLPIYSHHLLARFIQIAAWVRPPERYNHVPVFLLSSILGPAHHSSGYPTIDIQN